MKLSVPSKRMILFIGVSALVMIAGGALFYRSLKGIDFALGVILSSLLNVFKVFLLERTVKKTLDIENPASGKAYIQLQYILRFILSAAVLVAAALIPFIDVMGAVFGIFTLQIAVLIVRSMKLPVEPAVSTGDSAAGIVSGSEAASEAISNAISDATSDAISEATSDATSDNVREDNSDGE